MIGDWNVYQAFISNCHVNTNGIGQCDISSQAWHEICNTSVDPFCFPPAEGVEWAWFLYNVAAVPTVIGIVSRVYNLPDGNRPYSYICSDYEFTTGVPRCS